MCFILCRLSYLILFLFLVAAIDLFRAGQKLLFVYDCNTDQIVSLFVMRIICVLDMYIIIIIIRHRV